MGVDGDVQSLLSAMGAVRDDEIKGIEGLSQLDDEVSLALSKKISGGD